MEKIEAFGNQAEAFGNQAEVLRNLIEELIGSKLPPLQPAPIPSPEPLMVLVPKANTHTGHCYVIGKPFITMRVNGTQLSGFMPNKMGNTIDRCECRYPTDEEIDEVYGLVTEDALMKAIKECGIVFLKTKEDADGEKADN